MKKKIFKILLLFVSVSFFMQSCRNESEKRTVIRNVILAEVTSLSDGESINYPGIVEEGESINAAFMADGKINKISVKEGDRVRKGQLLASLDDNDYRIGVSQLETQFNQMTKEKQRMDAMFENRNLAPNDYEKFEAGYKQLQLQLDLAKRNLEYTRLYSPADGYISSKYMSEGELIGAGTPIFNIIDDNNLKATVDLPVAVFMNRNNILSATGNVPGIKEEIPLKVLSFTPVPENNMLYRMKLSIPSSFIKELSPGMNITITLTTAENANNETLIPSRSIFSLDGTTYVWVYDNNDSTIHKKHIEIDGSHSGKLNKVKGLDINDKIVETGVKQLYEGEKVNILNRKDFDL